MFGTVILKTVWALLLFEHSAWHYGGTLPGKHILGDTMLANVWEMLLAPGERVGL